MNKVNLGYKSSKEVLGQKIYILVYTNYEFFT